MKVMVKADTSECLVHMTCGYCQKYSLAVPLQVFMASVIAFCPECKKANVIMAL